MEKSEEKDLSVFLNKRVFVVISNDNSKDSFFTVDVKSAGKDWIQGLDKFQQPVMFTEDEIKRISASGTQHGAR